MADFQQKSEPSPNQGRVLRKLASFFDGRDRSYAIGLLLLLLIGAGFEALGIALIFPFAALINNPDLIQQNKILSWWYQSLGIQSTRQFLVWCGGGLLLLYLLKTVYLSLLYYIQYRFIFNQQVKLSHRLLNAYLHSPYTFHLSRNSSELLKNINAEAMWVFSGIMVPLFSVIVEALVITLITMVLLVADPIAALAAIGVLGGGSALFYRLIRRKAVALGEKQQRHGEEMIRWVQQSLGGIKETKVLGREAFFVDAYTRSSSEYARAQRFVRTANELPRLAIEGFTMGGIMLIVIVMLIRGQDMQSILPLLGLFAMAAIRLMPSFNRIISGMTMMRYYTPSIHVVHRDLQALTLETPREPCSKKKASTEGLAASDLYFSKAIELRNVRYQYPGAHKLALLDVSLTVPRGCSVAFVGPSGSGKTTVVDVILGLLTPTQGQVLVDGEAIYRNLAAWQRKIGYIPQRIYLADDTIRRNIAFGLADEEINDERVQSAVKAAQLMEMIDALPKRLDSVVGEHGVRLSAGQRQRIGIARALYHDPEVLVLDEATAALDNETEGEVSKAIMRLSGQKTIIIIAHRLTTVRNCDCLFFMRNGQVTAAASYDDLLNSNRDFQNMVNAAAVSI